MSSRLQMKICSKCEKERDEICFNKSKTAMDGLYSTCKICKKEYRDQNKDRFAAQKRQYYKENPEKLKEIGRRYRAKNAEKDKSRKKLWRDNNREKLNSINRKYFKAKEYDRYDKKVQKNEQQAEREFELLAKHNQELVTKHIKFAHGIVARYKNSGIHVDDLKQVAVIGLMRASSTFDQNKGSLFTSYAYNYVKSYIINEIENHFRIKTVSIDAENENGQSMADSLSSENLNPLEILENKETQQVINKSLLGLTNDEQLVCNLLFGFNGNDEYSAIEIADLMGLSVGGVEDIKIKALDKLRVVIVKF